MHDQPDIQELVASVRDFLRHHAMPLLKDHAAFHARVAANALDIVERELQQAPEQNAAELKRLKNLLDQDGDLDSLNRKLCAAIRKGEMNSETPGLIDHLWSTTLAKVAVDQPKYATYKRALEDGRV